MIKTQIDMKAIRGDITKLRKALGKTSEDQGRELAGSCCYIAARLSRPIEAGRLTGGSRLSAAIGKKQQASIEGAITAYALRVTPQDTRKESLGSLVVNHAQRVRSGQKIMTAKRIFRQPLESKARSSDANFDALKKQIAKRVGWNKASWIKGMAKVNPRGKQGVPKYISRHLGRVPVSVSTQNVGEKWGATITNKTGGSGEAFDENAYDIASHAATEGQIKRYEAQLRKAIKEARLS